MVRFEQAIMRFGLAVILFKYYCNIFFIDEHTTVVHVPFNHPLALPCSFKNIAKLVLYLIQLISNKSIR